MMNTILKILITIYVYMEMFKEELTMWIYKSTILKLCKTIKYVLNKK